ncbi:collagen alpha-5(VI) chain-like [Physella acuta]|uniref:collagen alpha-5(VI) chain-like n=1 Tax=Physella acuta TaxID=109671 RepID=UPI0027DB6386|nr:collagen alpha-5(VI) chain-like [Physella acuta]
MFNRLRSVALPKLCLQKLLPQALKGPGSQSAPALTDQVYNTILGWNMFSNKETARKSAQSVAVYITDGSSAYLNKSIDPLKKLGAKIVTIGIGSSVSVPVLNAQSSSADDALLTASFDTLSDLKNKTVQRTCLAGSKLLTYTSGSVLCPANTILDAIFLFEYNGTAGTADWNKGIQFIIDITKFFKFGANDARFAVVTFAKSQVRLFDLRNCTGTTSFETVRTLNATSLTDQAYKTILGWNLVGNNRGVRNAVPGVVILISDGLASPVNNSAQTASKLKAAGARVISVGVNNVSLADLMAATTGINDLLVADTFDALSLLKTRIVDKTCAANPLTPQLTCSSGTVLDLIFILDSSTSQGFLNWNKQVQLVVDVIKQLKLGPKDVQVAAVAYSSYPIKIFDLKTFSDYASIEKALKAVEFMNGQTYTHTAFNAIKNWGMFEQAAGGRPNALPAMVLISDGYANFVAETSKSVMSTMLKGNTLITFTAGNDYLLSDLNRYTFREDIILADSFDASWYIKSVLVSRICEASLYRLAI